MTHPWELEGTASLGISAKDMPAGVESGSRGEALRAQRQQGEVPD